MNFIHNVTSITEGPIEIILAGYGREMTVLELSEPEVLPDELCLWRAEEEDDPGVMTLEFGPIDHLSFLTAHLSVPTSYDFYHLMRADAVGEFYLSSKGRLCRVIVETDLVFAATETFLAGG